MPTPSSEETAPHPPGVVERLVRDDADRKSFLKAVGSGGAASFGAFVLAACGSSSKSRSTSAGAAAGGATATTHNASSTSSSGDLKILNYALTLEYLETEFYKKVIAANLFSGSTGRLVQDLGAQEQTHVDALKQTITNLGGTPVAMPNGRFPLGSAAAVAKLAYTVENLGAGAYLGQAANIQSKQVLAAALSIHSVEARHAAALGTLVSKSVTPDGAFGKPLDMASVLVAVKPFLA